MFVHKRYAYAMRSLSACRFIQTWLVLGSSPEYPKQLISLFILYSMLHHTRIYILARDVQAELALIVAQCLSIHLCVCPQQLESRVCTQHCVSWDMSTTGLFSVLRSWDHCRPVRSYKHAGCSGGRQGIPRVSDNHRTSDATCCPPQGLHKHGRTWSDGRRPQRGCSADLPGIYLVFLLIFSCFNYILGLVLIKFF